MEDRIVKMCAYGVLSLVILVCASFFYLPSLHRYEESVRQQYIEEAALRDNIKEMTGLELLVYNNRVSEIREEEVYFGEQLRIAMPSGTDASSVQIGSDYRAKTVSLYISGADPDYLYQYPMLGNPDNILDLTFENMGEYGVLEISLDSVMEYTRRDHGEYLYLDFKYPKEVYRHVIVIDPGHGGKAVGAVREDVQEKNVNLAIAEKLEKILKEEQGNQVGVYLTRTDDTNPSFEERVALANEIGADMFISIHNNATERKENRTSGTTVLYPDPETAGYDSKRLAEIFSEEVSSAFDTDNLGATEGNTIYILRNAKVPAVLIEVGFLSNQEELRKLDSEEYQEKAAYGIYEAFMRAYREN